MELGRDRVGERPPTLDTGMSCPASDCPTDCGCCPLSSGAGISRTTGPGDVDIAAAMPVADLSKLTDGKVTLRICGLDLSGVRYKGPDCSEATSDGAWVVLGIGPVGSLGTAPRKFQRPGVWLRVFSHLSAGSIYCNPTTFVSNPDLGYRKYHVQVWGDGLESRLGQQYNTEKGEPFGPAYNDTEKLDLVLQLTRTSALTFSFEVWTRLHVSRLVADGCSQSNQAINTKTGIQQWVHVAAWHTSPIGATFDTIPFTSPTLEARLLLENGPGPNAMLHVLTWQGLRLEAR